MTGQNTAAAATGEPTAAAGLTPQERVMLLTSAELYYMAALAWREHLVELATGPTPPLAVALAPHVWDGTVRRLGAEVAVCTLVDAFKDAAA